MPELSLTVSGAPATLAYSDVGHGPPLVLVHGFPLDGRIWDDVVPLLLERSIRVIVPDLPGFGRSKLEASAFTMQSMADSLVALLDALKLDTAVFAGLSMGGYILQALVRISPDRGAGLSFVDTKASADDEKGKAGRDAMIALAHEQGTPAIVEQMLPKMVGPRTKEGAEIVVARLKSIMLDQPPATLAAACAAMRDRADFTAHLSSLPCPLQILAGEADAIAPLEVQRAMHAAAPGSRLDLVPDAGHMAPIERPAEVARLLADFAGGIRHAS